MNVSNNQINTVLMRLMSERGIGVNELARRLGRSSGRMSERLTGKVDWKLGDLFAAAEALGVSATRIIADIEAGSARSPDVG